MKKMAAVATMGAVLAAGAWVAPLYGVDEVQPARADGIQHNELTLSLDGDGNLLLREQGDSINRLMSPDGGISVDYSSSHALTDFISSSDSVALDTLRIRTLDGNDVLSIDNSQGLIPGIIAYDGGEGFDSLALYGSMAANTTYSPGPGIDQGIVLQEHAGTTQRVDFSGLEPVQVLAPTGGNNILNVASAPLGIGFPSVLGGPNTISYVEGPNSNDPVDPVFAGALSGFVAVDGFETLEFANFEVLNIDAGFGSDEVFLRNPVMPDELVVINVYLDDGDDVLAITPLAGVEIFAEGGEHAFGDTLIVDAMGLPVEDTGTQILVSGLAPINYSGFENVEVGAGHCAADLSACKALVSDLEQQLAATTADEDDDGLFDQFDRCSGTETGLAVDDSGCSQEQFCSSIDAESAACRRADWKNDEPIGPPKDCRRKSWQCVAKE